MKELAAFLYEQSPFDGFWSAWLVGFCVVAPNGTIYLTEAGEEYLAGAA